MFDSLFAFFFKYSPYVFEQGELRLALSSPVYIAVGTGGGGGARNRAHVSKRSGRCQLARPRRAHHAAALPGRHRPLLPVPAGPDPARGRAAAELPRHPAGRLAKHARRRSRRQAARRVRQRDVRARQPRHEGAVEPLRRARLPVLVEHRPRRRGPRFVVRRHADQARRGAAAREGRVYRPAARRPGDGDRRRRHRGVVDSGIAARTARQPGAGVHRRHRPRNARAATSRSAASARRAKS